MTKWGLVYFLMVLFLGAKAQGDKDVINIRQRLLQNKPQELHEEVDSFHLLHLMIGGNVYQTEKHVNYAYEAATGKYDFSNEFKYVQPLLNLGDISIVNLKTSFGDNSTDMFSSPDEFALTLKYAGINAVMHANMHTANVDKATLKRTRDVLNKYDMYHTGAFEDQMERTGNYPLIIDKKGFRVAILNYTKLPSRPQVSRGFVINEVDKTSIDKDMRLAQAYKPDFVIVYFDWSDNFQDIPNHAQQALAQYVFEKGASLVVGACPNNPMRIDYVNYFYKGVAREGVVAYSLGNLLGSDETIKNRNGYLMDMEVKKNIYTNETHISDWGVVPVYTYYDTTSVKGKTNVYSVPCWAIESGDIFKNIPYIEKRRAVNSAYEVRKLLGANADEVQYNLNEMIVNNVKETIQITSASLNNKYSLARAGDLKPSAAPAVPLAAADPKSSASLEKVYQQSSEPSLALVAAPATDKKTAAYSKEKKKAEDIFASASNSTADTTKKLSTAVAVKEPAKPAQVKETAAAITTAKVSNMVSTFNVEATPDLNTGSVKDIAAKNDTAYRVQIYSLKTNLPLDTDQYPHLKGYEMYEENGLYKYVLGSFKTYEACYDYWKGQIQPRYKQSFIVKFINGRRALK